MTAPSLLSEITGWRRWWLPPNFSRHGGQIDLLFLVIFLVTVAVGILVLFYMARFCIKYRHRAGVKAHFTHGNKKLELIWTIIPAILLLALALWTKGAWDQFRYAPEAADPNRAQIMVIAEQFKWNMVYPGPDGKLGRYLIFPKTTDTKWPAPPPGEENALAISTGVPGPAFLPPDKALKVINDYTAATGNPLGKDFADPNGWDDDWQQQSTLHVPRGRPVEIHLYSKDVIHDLFLPEFRVKLDAVPGMRGLIHFTATKTNEELEKPTERNFSIAELEKAIVEPEFDRNDAEGNPQKIVGLTRIGAPEIHIRIPAEQATPLVMKSKTVKKVRERGKMVEKEVEEETPIVDRQVVTPEMIVQLKAQGVTEVDAYVGKIWDIVCEELCGSGHTTMQGRLIVLEPEDYARQFEKKEPAMVATGSAAVD